MASFVPPFHNPLVSHGRDNFEPSARGSGGTVDCSEPQTQLGMCCKSCDITLTPTMARDCTAALTWACVLTQTCPSCTSEISRTLDCFGVVEKCGFVQCDDVPLPPSLAGYYGQAPDTSTTNTMAPASSPAALAPDAFSPTVGYEETLFPTVNPLRVTENETDNVNTPLFAAESGVSGHVLGWNTLIVVVVVWVVAFRN